MFHSRSNWVSALLGLCACGLPACGADPKNNASASGRAPTEAAAVGRDPRLDEARRAIEGGFPDAAWTLLEQIGAAGTEAGLLRARAALVERDAVGALRELESVRSSQDAGDPLAAELYATEVEVLAALDRLQSARELLRSAYAKVGRTAVLERARGVVLLRTPGGALEALGALEGALARRPDLAFIGFPLAQARLLVGREKLAEDDPEAALLLARQAQSYDPIHAEYRELEAEALDARMLFEEALEIYEGLEAEGRRYGATPALLHQKLATRLLLQSDREQALLHYLRARELGLGDEGLGFGVEVLEMKALQWIDQGIAHFGEERFDAAAEAFREALALSPANLEAQNHMGVARFQLGDYTGAAKAWGRLMAQAQKAAIALPDPVHLNLARAWKLAGDAKQARAVLSEYIDGDPEGAWIEATRELLAQLELEELAGER
jgi:tetratricopeptide (TPR) repeat protein